MNFGPPNFWLMFAIIALAFGLGWLAKVLSKDPNPHLSGVEYVLGQLFLYRDLPGVFDRLEAEAEEGFDTNKHAKLFNEGMRDGLAFYHRMEDSGILALEDLQTRLNHMVNTGECSLTEVSIPLDVIDSLIGVGYPTSQPRQEQTP
ncbi:hypothetical protein [Stenotrophomonas phage A1432]|uniref:Uncharacterized protein n=1 Tax=Stenotrophomonas phage A1432 TaxID=2930315 RepID=A0A9E7SRR1_9CAUD|nr:hypothetical protein P9A45_gp76 [Stenotrophomonas phage A1432]UTC27954.1 hypothetical protein [Stenotrophomonas phage A1432]